MSLDQLFKQNQSKRESTASEEDGEFRAQLDEIEVDNFDNNTSQTRRATSKNNRSANTRKSKDNEAALPEKKRARRRLIGAVALVLAAVIGLPMIFDSEPPLTSPKIAIDIPSKDVLPNPPTNANISPSQPKPSIALPVSSVAANVTTDANEQIVNPVDQNKGKTPTVQPTQVLPVTAPAQNSSALGKLATAANSNVAATKSSEKVSSAVRPSTSDQQAATSKAASTVLAKANSADKNSEAERVNALLEGREAPKAKVETTAKAPETKTALIVQVAALNSASKVKELQNKLKAAGIASYTQKISTEKGEISRIRVGPLNSKAEAEKIRAKLVKIGLSGSIVPK